MTWILLLLALLVVHLRDSVMIFAQEDSMDRHVDDIHGKALDPLSQVRPKMTPAQINQLTGKTYNAGNEEGIAESVGFQDFTNSPYPSGNVWYEVNISDTQHCYLQFADPAGEEYNLRTLSEADLDGMNGFLTHRNPCGVCSSLQDLSVYLKSGNTLHNKVMICGMRPSPTLINRCMSHIGFSKRCSAIWMWSTINTKKSMSNGGCFKTCMRHLTTPSNEFSGVYNPCAPRISPRDSIDRSTLDNDKKLGSPKVPYESIGDQKRHVYGGPMRLKDPGYGSCRNMINKKNACELWKYSTGPFRLNPCLQCQECRSAPLFRKIAGRTLRNSGINLKTIKSPAVIPVVHNYYDTSVGITIFKLDDWDQHVLDLSIMTDIKRFEQLQISPPQDDEELIDKTAFFSMDATVDESM